MNENRRFPVFSERFGFLLEHEAGGNATDFAKKLGLSRQTVGFYLRGERIPDIQTLCQICTRCKVSADWLLALPPVEDQICVLACSYTGLSKETVDFLHSQKLKGAKP